MVSARDVPFHTCGAGARRQATASPASFPAIWLRSFSCMMADSPGLSWSCRSMKYMSTSVAGMRWSMAFRTFPHIALPAKVPLSSSTASADCREAGWFWNRSRWYPGPEALWPAASQRLCFKACSREPPAADAGALPIFRSTRRKVLPHTSRTPGFSKTSSCFGGSLGFCPSACNCTTPSYLSMYSSKCLKGVSCVRSLRTSS
mmetsp:Transcript_117019/g.277954  ORF Transcript_117019/g.277954 Transcript_117019/m.277954 type:complete len:203 (+) Transcript_117019:1028-1636(+)